MTPTQILEDLTGPLFDIDPRKEGPSTPPVLDLSTDNGCGTTPNCSYPPV